VVAQGAGCGEAGPAGPDYDDIGAEAAFGRWAMISYGWPSALADTRDGDLAEQAHAHGGRFGIDAVLARNSRFLKAAQKRLALSYTARFRKVPLPAMPR
jgi:hypothetical protein